jgi:hypothetical protein
MAFTWSTALAMLLLPAAKVKTPLPTIGNRNPLNFHIVPKLPAIDDNVGDNDGSLANVEKAIAVTPPSLPPKVKAPAKTKDDVLATFLAEYIDVLPGDHIPVSVMLRECNQALIKAGLPAMKARGFGIELKYRGCKKYVAPRNRQGVRPTMIIIPDTVKKRRRRA